MPTGARYASFGDGRFRHAGQSVEDSYATNLDYVNP
jgi:hypothetical protein